jgi:hypothetical protein
MTGGNAASLGASGIGLDGDGPETFPLPPQPTATSNTTMAISFFIWDPPLGS